MSDPTNIFDGNSNPNPQGNNNGLPSNGNSTPPSDQASALLAMIKNEKGEQKYKDIHEALNALAHSQAYIPQLKNELDTTKNQLTQAQEQANKIKELEQTILQLTQNNAPKTDQSGELSEEKIAEIVTNTINRNQTAATQKQNLDNVVAKVRSVHGDKASEYFYNKAKEMGLSAEQINSLAASSPAAALTLLGVSEPLQTRPGINTPGINTTGFLPKPDSQIGVNKESVLIGATTDRVRQETDRSRKMVDELHADGLTTYDLTDPKVYKKYFRK